jgi:hypothetical protein
LVGTHRTRAHGERLHLQFVVRVFSRLIFVIKRFGVDERIAGGCNLGLAVCRQKAQIQRVLVVQGIGGNQVKRQGRFAVLCFDGGGVIRAEGQSVRRLQGQDVPAQLARQRQLELDAINHVLFVQTGQAQI